ncbi:MAG: hypothetical protein FWG27_07110 [Treponema sp.]|nr:hypothetical protein [Treponema sp.]
MKSRYGVTPWGSWFIDVLDSYRKGARLDREDLMPIPGGFFHWNLIQAEPCKSRR